jgi:hypothetical protein
MSLATGQKLSRQTWDVLPMPNSVIDRVNTLGKDQPELFEKFRDQIMGVIPAQSPGPGKNLKKKARMVP